MLVVGISDHKEWFWPRGTSPARFKETIWRIEHINTEGKYINYTLLSPTVFDRNHCMLNARTSPH